MKVVNGIIIDGVLHELVEAKSVTCDRCSLHDLCYNEMGDACVCWVHLMSEHNYECVEFKNHGKVKIEKWEEKKK